jgi:hypothetical protein
VTGAFQWVIDKVLTPLKDLGSSIGSGIKTAFDDAAKFLGKVGNMIAAPITAAFTGVVDFFKNIGTAFKSLFSFDFAGFSTALNRAFSSAMEGVVGIFRGVVNPIIDLINALKFEEVKVKGKFLGESFGFTLIPAMDLIPGDIPTFHSGGFVNGEGDVPAVLKAGEFVVNDSAVRSLGLNALEQINSGRMPASGDTNVSVNMEITTTQPVDESFIRQRLVPRIKEELRRASLDGAFVIARQGIRT